MLVHCLQWGAEGPVNEFGKTVRECDFNFGVRGSGILLWLSSGRDGEKRFWYPGGVEDEPGEMGRSWGFLRLNFERQINNAGDCNFSTEFYRDV